MMTHSSNPLRNNLPPRLPQFIENLNALAREYGLSVEMLVEPFEGASAKKSAPRLWSEWRGSRDAFLKLVDPIPSFHLPLSRGWVSIPGGAQRSSKYPLIKGDLKVTGESVLFCIDWGLPDFAITVAGDVEIVTYADEIVYHGEAAAISALGIDLERLPQGRKEGKRFTDDESTGPLWSSRRQPDGSIVYREESPAACRRRAQEWNSKLQRLGVYSEKAPRVSHLRLVVDNTRVAAGLHSL